MLVGVDLRHVPDVAIDVDAVLLERRGVETQALVDELGEVDRLIEAVQLVAQRKWRGQYEIKGGGIESASAGRCADAWMEEASAPEAATGPDDQSSSSTNTFVNSTPE